MRIRYGLAALLALLLSAPTMAQESAAIVAAKHHFRTQSPAAFAADDLADLHATDAYLDRRTGATNVYLAQRYAGIEIWGTVAPAAVLPSGKVHALAPAYHSRLATRVNTTAAQVASGAAVSAAEAYVRRFESAQPTGPVVTTDAPGAPSPNAPITFEASEPQLIYQPTDSGALRLAWATTLSSQNGPLQLVTVRVDAVTGTVLGVDDHVARDQWPAKPVAPEAPVSLAPLAPEASMPLAAARAGSYRVIPWPVESPSHGDYALVTDPADPTASELGWHDTGSQQFTTTRGNNVWAYLDRDDNEAADVGTAPEGGASLTFDVPYTTNRQPRENIDAATINLFYWGNVFHDITYQYGFDEAAGNFQVNNFGRGGAANDPAFLETQSGADVCNETNPCVNNANFATPRDGSSGRMQMYEWRGAAAFNVSAPSTVAAAYPASAALFGTGATVSGAIVTTTTSGGIASRGCTAADIANAAAVAGNIALIERGGCSFTTKVRNAQAAGAIGAVIHNNDRKGEGEDGSPEDLVGMSIGATEADDITIPSLFVQNSTGLLLRQREGAAGSLTLQVQRDSGLDAGVVAHEFGHGLSTRLTGGPSQNGCLSNQEQMGEGWSDYYGLLTTMETADDTPRGIATYLSFEGTDGGGIRPARYTRDMNVNPLTYEDVITRAGVAGSGISIPHGLGSVWATVLWDMTLDLVDEYGFDRDVYDADGGKGNQIAMNLVTQGLKLQPCLPGFVSGRDAILNADTLLYNGRNSDLIWAAFARRGLGVGASQGLTSNANDGNSDFNPPTVSRESGPNASGARLVVTGPNPVRGTTALSLSLVSPEAVTVHVVDLLGRSVQTLHDGPLAADRHTVELDASGLAPGVYVVRAQGETFSAAQRVTVVR
ncbi:M36 family metallopeptidase [Rubricoccus marinus]|uniref:PA domain-containing protein n=1 Tax=Rubricoccus marinus TaxID=716817 RepID=A0A259TV26_9BACT|nr:M36 family metallopeptidase [Rubricoccus marinus]OZC01619.1 hypothetical protein BSZ36_00645 [Rubricoccus marinus]